MNSLFSFSKLRMIEREGVMVLGNNLCPSNEAMIGIASLQWELDTGSKKMRSPGD